MDAEADAVALTLGDGEREPERVTLTVALDDRLAVLVTELPYDTLGDMDGDTDGVTDGVTDGGTHELRTTDPAPPAAPGPPPPTFEKPA